MADASGSSGSTSPHAPVSSSAVSDAINLEAQQQEVHSSLDVTMHRTSSSAFSFDGDDLVVEIVGELAEESMTRSLEAFYECRLPGYASQCGADAVFDAVFALLETPCVKCERLTNGDSEICREGNDPVMQVLCRLPSALAEPEPNAIDPFCFYGVPLRSPVQPAATILSQMHGSNSIPVGIKLQHCGAASNYDDPRGSHSRPPSQSSSFRARKAAPTPPSAPVSPRSAPAAAQLSANDANGEYHAPGVVYSTAPPPPRVSPRKVMTLLKNAHRLSSTAPAASNHSRADGERDVPSTSSEENENDTSASDSVPLNGGVRGNKQGHRRDSSGFTSAWGSGGMQHENDDDMETTVRPYMEENAPVQVEFAIKRGVGERRRSSNKSGLQQHLLLPELSPQRRLSRNATPPVYPLSELKPDGSLLLTTDQDSEQLGLSHDAGSEHFSEDPASLQSPLKTLVLAPGVKLQNGDEMKVGPELPLFPTHMRKATFYVSHLFVSVSIAAAGMTSSASRYRLLLSCAAAL